MDAIERRAPMFTNKALVAMFIPVMLDSLLSILAGMVDSAMVSSAGEAAVSAVSLVDAINVLCITVFSGMANGGGVVLSQYVGHGDKKQARSTANQLLYLAVSIALVFTVVLSLFRVQVLRLIYGSIEQDVFENAKVYFLITILGYPFSAIGAAATAVLRSTGKTRQSAYCTIAFNVFNVIGNSVLIYGLEMGVAGAAIATTVARMAYAGMGLLMAQNKQLPAYFENILKFRLDFAIIRRCVGIGSASAMENGLFYVGRLLISGLISTFGTVAITAYSVSNTINNIGWVIVSAFGVTLMPVVGQCVGAGEQEQAKGYTKKLLTAATVTTVVLFSSLFLLRNVLVRIYQLDAETLEACGYYTGVLALFSIAGLYSFCFTPLSAFRAAGDIKYAVTLSIITMFAFRVALAYALNWLFPDLGLMCVCISMGVDWLFRAVCNIIRFRNGKWLHKRLI